MLKKILTLLSFTIITLPILSSCNFSDQNIPAIPENYFPPSFREIIGKTDDFTKDWGGDAELIGVHIPLASSFLSDNSPGLIQFTFRSDSSKRQVMNILCLGQDCEPTVMDTESETCYVSISDPSTLMDSTQILETGIKFGGDVFLEEKGRVDLYLQHPCDSEIPIWRLVFLNIAGTDVLELVFNAEDGNLINSKYESVK